MHYLVATALLCVVPFLDLRAVKGICMGVLVVSIFAAPGLEESTNQDFESILKATQREFEAINESILKATQCDIESLEKSILEANQRDYEVLKAEIKSTSERINTAEHFTRLMIEKLERKTIAFRQMVKNSTEVDVAVVNEFLAVSNLYSPLCKHMEEANKMLPQQ